MTNGQAKKGWEKEGLQYPIFNSKSTLKYGNLYSKYLVFTLMQISVKFAKNFQKVNNAFLCHQSHAKVLCTQAWGVTVFFLTIQSGR